MDLTPFLFLVNFLVFGSSTYAPGAKSESESTSKKDNQYGNIGLIEGDTVPNGAGIDAKFPEERCQKVVGDIGAARTFGIGAALLRRCGHG